MPIAPKTSVIPRRVNALKACTQGATYEGVIMPQELPRLLASVGSIQRDIGVKICFSRDESGYRKVIGTLTTCVSLECQRCLLMRDYDLHAEINLAIVTNEEQLERLPNNYEGWLLGEDGEADLYEAVEEESLLALPIVAYHDEQDCSVEGSYSTGDFKESTPVRKNPFEVLKGLELVDKTGSKEK